MQILRKMRAELLKIFDGRMTFISLLCVFLLSNQEPAEKFQIEEESEYTPPPTVRYARVTPSRTESEITELPLNEDGTLCLTTVCASFAGVIGLKYNTES